MYRMTGFACACLFAFTHLFLSQPLYSEPGKLNTFSLFLVILFTSRIDGLKTGVLGA